MQLYRLAAGRALFLLPHLNEDTGNIGGACAKVLDNFGGGPADFPIDQFELDNANDVFRRVLAPLLAERAGVDTFEFVHVEDALFDGSDQGVLFPDREIVAGFDLDLQEFRLNRREKLDAASERAIGPISAHQHGEGGEQGQTRAARERAQHADIGASQAGKLAQVTAFGDSDGTVLLLHAGPALADHATQHRNEYQRHEQGGGERDQHGDRQELHELADHPAPEQQGQEHA